MATAEPAGPPRGPRAGAPAKDGGEISTGVTRPRGNLRCGLSPGERTPYLPACRSNGSASMGLGLIVWWNCPVNVGLYHQAGHNVGSFSVSGKARTASDWSLTLSAPGGTRKLTWLEKGKSHWNVLYKTRHPPLPRLLLNAPRNQDSLRATLFYLPLRFSPHTNFPSR